MQVRGKAIPNRGTHDRESPIMSGGLWELSGERRPEQAKVQVKELPKISRRFAQDTVPDNNREPTMDMRQARSRFDLSLFQHIPPCKLTFSSSDPSYYTTGNGHEQCLLNKQTVAQHRLFTYMTLRQSHASAHKNRLGMIFA